MSFCLEEGIVVQGSTIGGRRIEAGKGATT